ncbi:MAG: thioredoxin domain-containing protein [Planctomycetota bacterium]|nr:thioredoxin domain-containing protein [Planctomycetota bacterium]
MDRVTFGNKKAKDILKGIVIVKVDADEQVNAQIYKKYDVQLLPTLLFVDPDGKKLNQVNMASIDELAKAVQKAKSKIK